MSDPLEVRSLYEEAMTAGRCPRVLFFGSRRGRLNELFPLVEPHVTKLPRGSLVIHGGAVGADMMAKRIAVRQGLFAVAVDVEREHYTRWNRMAPRRRNYALGQLLDPEHDWAEGFIAARHPNLTAGSAHMVEVLREMGIPTNLHWLTGEHSTSSHLIEPRRIPLGKEPR